MLREILRIMMTRKEKAMDYFSQGYNCAQAVSLAFADLVDIDERTLALASSSFGGGVGRMREVCGAVSGMAMIIGLLYGNDDPKDANKKAALYERVQVVAKKYEADNGSIVCRSLLGLDVKHDAPTPEKRTDEYYKKRPCNELVGYAAEILEEYLKEGMPNV